jgi:hypothetical protein
VSDPGVAPVDPPPPAADSGAAAPSSGSAPGGAAATPAQRGAQRNGHDGRVRWGDRDDEAEAEAVLDEGTLDQPGGDAPVDRERAEDTLLAAVRATERERRA